jgi:hypothetical protein
MKIKDISKDILLAQQREMKEYHKRYMELVEEGKNEEAAVYYKKTLETASRLVENGQKILENVLNKLESRVSNRSRLRAPEGAKTADGLMYIPPQDDDIIN